MNAPRSQAHGVALLAAFSLVPFMIVDGIQIELWHASWDIWLLVLGASAIYCVVLYGMTRALIWVGRKFIRQPR